MGLLLTACEKSDPTEPEETAAISISQPANNANVMDIVTIRAGIGSDYSITRVVFYVDDDSVYNDNVSPFLYQWDTSIYPANSQHTLYARGYDTDTSYISTTITVTVTVPSPNEFGYIKSYSLASPALSIAANGDFVYAVLGSDGLKAIDISNPSNPVETYHFQAGTNLNGVDASGAYLVSAELYNGIRLFDISNSDTVIVKNQYNTSGNAWNVNMVGNLIYVADSDRLTIASISNYNITYVSQIVISSGIVKDVGVSGSIVYIMDENGVSRYNLSDPSNPSYLGRNQAFTGQCQCISVYGDYVFVGTTSQLSMLSSSLSLITTSAQQQGYTGVYAIEDVVFVSQGGSSGGARVFDYNATDSSLVQLDSFITSEICNDVTYIDSYLILAGTSKLDILRFNYSPTD